MPQLETARRNLEATQQILSSPVAVRAAPWQQRSGTRPTRDTPPCMHLPPPTPCAPPRACIRPSVRSAAESLLRPARRVLGQRPCRWRRICPPGQGHERVSASPLPPWQLYAAALPGQDGRLRAHPALSRAPRGQALQRPRDSGTSSTRVGAPAPCFSRRQSGDARHVYALGCTTFRPTRGRTLIRH